MTITSLVGWIFPSMVKTARLPEKVQNVIDRLPVAEELVKNYSPQQLPRSAKDVLLLFKSQSWSEMGYDDGNSFHSHEIYADKVSEISQKYNAICLESEKEIKLEIKKAKNDVEDAGSNKSMSDKAKANQRSLEEDLGYLQSQRGLDHKNNIESECHVVIEQYRNGFNRGWDTYFRRSGNSK